MGIPRGGWDSHNLVMIESALTFGEITYLFTFISHAWFLSFKYDKSSVRPGQIYFYKSEKELLNSNFFCGRRKYGGVVKFNYKIMLLFG